MFLLAAMAHAEPTDDVAAPEECAQTEVWATSPAPLATGVPVDTVPAGLVAAGNCGAWTATLSVPATAEVVATVTHGDADGLLIEVDPGGDLDPDTTYTLRFEAVDGGGESSEIGFTTGTGRAAGLDGGPTVESAIVAVDPDGRAQVQAEITAAGSSDGATIVALAIEGEDAAIDLTSVSGPATVQLIGFHTFPEVPDEVCVVARQRDVAGNWADSPSDCVAPQLQAGSESCGCAEDRESTDVAASALVLLFAGFARRRRR